MKKYICFLTTIIFIICSKNLSSENLDEYLSRRIREDLSSPFIDKTMNGFTQLGSYKVSSLILLSMYTVGNERLRTSAKLSMFSIAGATLACTLIKFSVNRERPCGNNSRLNSSFPSGHATGAFAFSYIIAKRHPKTAIPLYLTAATVAFSRVYLGKHYLSDVIAGTVLGLTTGWFVMRNEQTILKIEF